MLIKYNLDPAKMQHGIAIKHPPAPAFFKPHPFFYQEMRMATDNRSFTALYACSHFNLIFLAQN